MADDSLTEESGTQTDFGLDSSTDSLTEETGTQTDFSLTDQPSITAAFDAAIKDGDKSRTANFDTVLKDENVSLTGTFDTVVKDKKTVTGSFDTAIKDENVQATGSFDTVIKDFSVEQGGTFDAAIKETDLSQTATFDSVIKQQNSQTGVFDTVLKDEDASTTGSFDTVIKSLDQGAGALFDTAIQEADLQVQATVDTVIKNRGQTTASIDTYIAFGQPGNFTAVIGGDAYTGVLNVEVEKQLNELHTFKFDAFIEDDQDRQKIQEGNQVLLFDGRQLIFQGELENVNYDSTFEAECEGSGLKLELLKNKTPRKEYINQPADDIIRDLLGGDSEFSLGTIENAPVITIRVDHDNELRAAAGVANAVGYDLSAYTKESEGFENIYVDFVERKGSSSSVATLNIAEELRLVDRGKDKSVVANDITVLGRGDGINQKEVRLFAATTHRTVTGQRIQAGDTTTLDVKDATQLGATGDEVYVRVGAEVVHANIQDSTTLDILGRAQTDYKGDSTKDGQHYEDIQVFLQENVTQSIGPFKPNRTDAEDGSSIDRFGNVEERSTDKTLIDRATVEKVCDNELKDRREPVFRVEVELTDPRGLADLGIEIGDQVTIEDLTAPDVSNDFRVVGIDFERASAGEGTTLHCANRPIRLVERLSEIERDRDTLNAHMQGATNFNGESFGDNCDSTHPVSHKVFIPDDVVEINKLELVFNRESFRGYVKNEDHSHNIDITHPEHSHTIDQIPDHDHDITIDIPDHSHDIENFLEGNGTAIRFSSDGQIPLDRQLDGLTSARVEVVGAPDSISTTGISSGSAGDQHSHYWPQDTSAGEGTIEVDFTASDFDHTHLYPPDDFLNTAIPCDLLTTNNGEPPKTTEAGGSYFESTTTGTDNTPDTTETSQTALGTTTSETTQNSGSPNYGIFEPSTEPDVDVEVKVDGNTVTTISSVSVGEERSTPIDLQSALSDPVTGEYHRIELVPTGQCRLSADVVQKVFIESKL